MNNITVTEFKNIRVLTTQQLADGYETNTDVISKNFSNNKDRYEEGRHYILLQGEELKEAKANGNIYGLPINANKFYLWTEKGAFLHAKSLNTDKAWEVYDVLVDTYFKKQSVLEELSPELQAIFAHDKKLQIIVSHMTKQESRLDKLEFDIPLYGCESKELSDHVKRKGVQVLGGKRSNAYGDNKIRSAIYRDIYDQVKREFGVYDEEGRKQTYLALKRKYLADAHKCIDAYVAPMYLQDQIRDANAQMVI
ncbi:MAG TPA: hypothetical protein GXX75_04680 [Clostridiales bacterium]|nr:hypothetical protein [Clostridiales bacterium]